MLRSFLSVKMILGVLIMLFSTYTHAQEKVPEQVYNFNDSLKQAASEHSIPAELMEKYRADEDFDYRYGYQQTVSIWQQIWQWVLQQIGRIFGEVNLSFSIEWLLYAFCAAMIIFAVLKLLDVNISGLFSRKKQLNNVGVQDILEEDIHELNFEEEISKAQQAEDFRRAIRLLYIYTLKKLSDSDLIAWHPAKTNADYQKELSAEKIASDFRSLSIYYEYAWYGEFPVDAILYDKVDQLHHTINRQLSVSI